MRPTLVHIMMIYLNSMLMKNISGWCTMDLKDALITFLIILIKGNQPWVKRRN